MSSEIAPDGDEILSVKYVLHALESVNDGRVLADVESWLKGGKRVESSLLQTPMKVPSESSRMSLQSCKSSNPNELNFILALSTLLNIDEAAADQLLKEYCQGQVLGNREETSGTLDLESLLTLESVRNFYFDQQQYLWKILQELLRIDKDEDHQCRHIARKNIEYLVSNNLLETILSRINSLQNWRIHVLTKLQFKSFIAIDATFALLDNRCSDFLGKHMLASAEFIGNELVRALETLILLLYTHCSLNKLQIETLMMTAGRDAYGIPYGCEQLVEAILGKEFTAQVPFLAYNRNGLPAVENAHNQLTEQLSVKYITIFTESLQFWRVLQPSNDDIQQTHPLLVDYVQNDMERFTAFLQESVTSSVFKHSKAGKVNVGSKVHNVIYFLWGLFLEMFGSSQRVETVLRPKAFSSWLEINQLEQPYNKYGDSNYSKSNNSNSNGNQKSDIPSQSIADIILSDTSSSGAIEDLIYILTSVLRLTTKNSETDTGTDRSGVPRGLGAILGINRGMISNKVEGSVSVEKEEEIADLQLVCTILQEVVNVIISVVCLGNESNSINDILNISLLVELCYRGDEILCDNFWNQWERRNDTNSDYDTKEEKQILPLCCLLEILLINTPQDPTYLFVILTSLASTSNKCANLLNILNQQVSMVKWVSVHDILFLENDYDDDEQHWTDIDTWKEGKESFIGVDVIFTNSFSSKNMSAGTVEAGSGMGDGGWGNNHHNRDDSRGVQRDMFSPIEGSRGVVCDVATNGKEELLIRWNDKMLWWGVVLDILGHSSVVATSMINENNDFSIVTSSEAIKTIVTLELLSVLMSKQGLLTGFYLESKWEQLLFHLALTKISFSHLFHILSQTDETLMKIISDPQSAYLRMTSNNMRISNDEAVQLISGLQEYVTKYIQNPYVHENISKDFEIQFNSQSVLSNNFIPSPVSSMICDNIVSITSTISKSLLKQSNQNTMTGQGIIKRELLIMNSFFNLSLRFLSTFALSSGNRAQAVSQSLSRKFELSGPGSFLEIIYRIAKIDGNTNYINKKNKYEITNEILTLLLSLLQSVFDNRIIGHPRTQQFLLSILTYVLTLFTDLQDIPFELGKDGKGKVKGIQYFEFLVGYRGILTRKCLDILFLFLSRTFLPNSEMKNHNNEKNNEDSLGEILLDRLVQDPRLIQSILRIISITSVVAILNTSVENVQNVHKVNESVKSKRVFKVSTNQTNNASDTVLPINYSTVFSILTQVEVGLCLTTTAKSLEILSLVLDLFGKYQKENLCVLLSVLGGRIDVPIGVINGTDKSLEGCTYHTILCGLFQLEDKITLGLSSASEMRLGAIDVLTDVILFSMTRINEGTNVLNIHGDNGKLFNSTSTSSSTSLSSYPLVDSIGLLGIHELCQSLCDMMTLTNVSTEKKITLAAFDFLLSLGKMQPGGLVLLLNIPGTNIDKNPLNSESSNKIVIFAEMKSSLLLSAISNLLSQAQNLYKNNPLLLHKLYEFVTFLWKNSSALRPLGLAAVSLIRMDSSFFSQIVVPLTHKLPDGPSFAINENQEIGKESYVSEDFSSLETITAESVSVMLKLAMSGHDVTEMLYNSKINLRLLEKSSTIYCHTLLCHSSSLQLLALERHGHLFSMDDEIARKANTEMKLFYQKMIEKNSFLYWLSNYMKVDINDRTAEEVSIEANLMGIELNNMINHSSHLTGSILGTKIKYGNNYIYNTKIIHKIIVSIFEKYGISLDNSQSYDTVINQIQSWLKLEKKIHFLNLQWSISDIQMKLLQNWKIFLQIFVLPGFSARKLAFKTQYENNKNIYNDKIEFDKLTPPVSPCIGSLSPSFDPEMGTPSNINNSNFIGDKRSYEVVDEILKQLEMMISSTTTTTSTTTSTSTSTSFSELNICQTSYSSSPAVIGYSLARVLLEKCEILTSMLHHQFSEVVVRTSDPRKSHVDTRYLGNTRLRPDKMKNLLVVLCKCYKLSILGLSDEMISEKNVSNNFTIYDRNQNEKQLKKLKYLITKELLTAMLLTLKGMKQMDDSSIQFVNNDNDSKKNSILTTSSSAELIKLQIFLLVLNVLKEEGKEIDINDNFPINYENDVTNENKIININDNDVYDKYENVSNDRNISINILALRLMKFCLPNNLNEMSLANAQAWNLSVQGPKKSLNVIFIELLKNLSEVIRRDGKAFHEHDYSSWNVNVSVGTYGSIVARHPGKSQSSKATIVSNPLNSFSTSSTTSSTTFSTNSSNNSTTHSSSPSSALLALLDLIYSGINSDVLSLSDIINENNNLFYEFCNIGIFQELQKVLLFHSASRSASLSGYSSVTGEISDLMKCWETVIDTMLLILSLLTDKEKEKEMNDFNQIEYENLREKIFDGIVLILTTFGPLLMLPLTHSFSDYNDAEEDISRLTLRRVKLCRCTVSLFYSVTKQFKVWKAVLPALFNAVQKEILRVTALYICLLTDVRLENTGGPHHPDFHNKDSNDDSNNDNNETEEEKSYISTPHGMISNIDNNRNKRRILFNHILAVTDSEKQGRSMTSSYKKRRNFSNPIESQTRSSKRVGLKVTFGKNMYQSAPDQMSFMAPGVKTTENTNSNLENLYEIIKVSEMQEISNEFVLKIEQEIIRTLVSLLMFIKESDETSLGSFGEFDTNVCVGSRVFYYSRAYESSTNSLQLIEGMIVSTSDKIIDDNVTQKHNDNYYNNNNNYHNNNNNNDYNNIHDNNMKNYNVTQYFEVVLANGAREFDVSPDDVVYSAAPLLHYQRLFVNIRNGNNHENVASNDNNDNKNENERYEYLVSDTLNRACIDNSSIKEEIWTGKGLKILNDIDITPVTYSTIGRSEGKDNCATAHLLRILAYATSKNTHTRLSELSNSTSTSTSAFSTAPATPSSNPFFPSSPVSLSNPSFRTPTSPLPPTTSNTTYSPAPAPAATGTGTFSSSTVAVGCIENELEVLAGLASWLCLGTLSHHSRSYIPRRSDPATKYNGGRPDMIEQLELLKCFVVGDARVLHPPKWLVSESWNQYKDHVMAASDEVIEKLKDKILPVIAKPEVVRTEPKKGTKIGLRTKLHFVSTPEDL